MACSRLITHTVPVRLALDVYDNIAKVKTETMNKLKRVVQFLDLIKELSKGSFCVDEKLVRDDEELNPYFLYYLTEGILFIDGLKTKLKDIVSIFSVAGGG